MPNIKHITLTIVFLVVVALSIGAAIQDYFVGDHWLAKTIQEATAAPWEKTMEVVSLIGQTPVLIAMALVLSTWFLWKKQRAEALTLLGVIVSFAIGPVLKNVVDRPRPADDLVVVWQDHNSLSFPSGHAFTAVVLFGILYYLVPLLVPGKAAAYITRASLVLLILLIGISRVYLGAHWPSDVLGGFLYGAITLAFLIRLHGWLSGRYGRLHLRNCKVD